MVFQESALFDSLTVRENVAFRLMEEGNISEEEIDRRVREALSFVELEHTIDMFPRISPAACGAGWRSPAPSSPIRR